MSTIIAELALIEKASNTGCSKGMVLVPLKDHKIGDLKWSIGDGQQWRDLSPFHHPRVLGFFERLYHYLKTLGLDLRLIVPRPDD